ncbi:prolyl oligopeptidase family serine peptidase [Acidobacteriota bacterium]
MKKELQFLFSSFLTGIFLRVCLLGVFLIFINTVSFPAPQQFEESYVLPAESVQDLFERDKHFDVLKAMGPDGDHFMIPVNSELSSLELMAQKTYRLAMLEFCPEVNREWRLSTYGTKGLKIYSLSQRKGWEVQLPKRIFISDMAWSPDGKKIAFLAHLKKGTQVWTVEVKSGKVEAFSEAFVMATLGGRPQRGRSTTGSSQMLQWTPDGSILTFLVPSDRGDEPRKSAIPKSPLIRRTREKPTPTRTYPFLLRTPHDKELFRYYTTAQLAQITSGQPPRKMGPPAMYLSISLSPDGKYVLAEKLVEPFSYIVSYTNFPRELQVLDMDGKVLSVIRKDPLQEAISRDRGGDDEEKDLPREVTWRPDGKGLSFLLKEEKEKDQGKKKVLNDSERKDRLMILTPPFDMSKAQTLIASDKKFSQTSYSQDGRYAFTSLTGKGNGNKSSLDMAAFDLTKEPPQKFILVKGVDPEDLLKLPGDIVTRTTVNGMVYVLLSSDKNSAYLQGPGYKENFKPQPFIDRVTIFTGDKERIFEGSQEMFEKLLVPLEDDMTQIIVSRESKSAFPDSYLWRKNESMVKLTRNQDPYPEITACKRVDFKFVRRDGAILHGRISLPVGFVEGTRVPALFWTYPREYTSEEKYKRAAIRARNQNAFTQLSFLRWSDIWLSQGYALVYPDIPIIGKGEAYNDNYIAHLVDSMYAAIRKLDGMGYIDIDRLGHGGHSYGAFATANILARTPFFKAGIAGDGAYNRTLTPMSFQSERRFLWEAKGIYLEMSPFFSADHIDTPLLMYHGAQDNNSGTFLIQSERMIQALTGLGKNAVLYVYPFESHGPRCKESYLDLWSRWLAWLDTYVKELEPEKQPKNR